MVAFRSGAATVRVTVPDHDALEAAVRGRLARGQGFGLATLNLDHLVKLRSDAAFATAYAAMDIVTADGNPIVWVARAGGHAIDLLPGADLILPLCRWAADAEAPVGLFGTTEDSLAKAAAALKDAVPGLTVAACIAPPMGFDPDGQAARGLLEEMDAEGVRLCLVALGAPKQERLAALGRQVVPDMGFACIGAGLDFLSGQQRRAPAWVRGIKMEWLWRMASQPGRLARRYMLCALILPGQFLQARRARQSSSPG